MRKSGLTLNIFLMIVATDIAETVAQLCIKKGLNITGIDNITLTNLFQFFSQNSTSVFIWLGMLVYLVNFFIWITVLSRVELSVAFPVGSTSYIFVPIMAIIFLGEHINPIRWLGIIFIVAGIHFVSKSTGQLKQ